MASSNAAFSAFRRLLTFRASIPARLEIAGVLASEALKTLRSSRGRSSNRHRMHAALQSRVYCAKWRSGRLYMSIDEMIQGLHIPNREAHLDYSALLKPGDTVCDVGAHIGTHVIKMLDAVGPKGQVIALEPDRRNFGLLCLNLHSNDVSESRIVLFRAALGPADGTCRLYTRGGSMYFSTVRESEHFVTVESVSFGKLLDQARNSRIDFMKIDIEGAEQELILSEEAAFTQGQIARLYIDPHTGVDYDVIAQHLARFGYSHSRLGDGHFFALQS